MRIATEAEKDAAAAADEEDVASLRLGLPAGLQFNTDVVGPRNPDPATMDNILEVFDALIMRATTRLLHAAVIANAGANSTVKKSANTNQHRHGAYQLQFFAEVTAFNKQTERLAPSEKLSKSSSTAYQSEEQGLLSLNGRKSGRNSAGYFTASPSI